MCRINLHRCTHFKKGQQPFTPFIFSLPWSVNTFELLTALICSHPSSVDSLDLFTPVMYSHPSSSHKFYRSTAKLGNNVMMKSFVNIKIVCASVASHIKTSYRIPWVSLHSPVCLSSQSLQFVFVHRHHAQCFQFLFKIQARWMGINHYKL